MDELKVMIGIRRKLLYAKYIYDKTVEIGAMETALELKRGTS